MSKPSVAAPTRSRSSLMGLGAIVEDAGVRFRVWAPKRRRVSVVLEDGPELPLEREDSGYFARLVEEARAGQRYRFRLDGDLLRPDPVSRFQPDGPNGPSEIVDLRGFPWSDKTWGGPLEPHRSIVYEMHLGTFTPEGTWESARRELVRLADLGISLLEVMPVTEFPGRFGWGYDGVDLFAPYREYGRPEEACRFVDEAHRLGLGVILDVVYNHFGPSGCYLRDFSDSYFTTKYENEWGEALNFDGDDAGPVREFFVENALYWIEEFHMDGLRLDATQAINDDSPEHVVAEICRRARAAAGDRRLLIVAENEPQDAALLRGSVPDRDGVDALWNDDFHHSAIVALTGHREAYYTDYLGTPQEFVSMARHGFLYQGQWYSWQKKGRGTPTIGARSSAFVTFLENHDQVANSGFGTRPRLRAHPGAWRALTAHLLLGPGLPMLFQGQEYSTTRPFVYFADHEADLARKVEDGRAEFLSQFPTLSTAEARRRFTSPSDPEAFARCKLDAAEREANGSALALHRDLIALRRHDPVFSRLGTHTVTLHGAVLGDTAFVLRHATKTDERLVIVNLGPVLELRVMNEPLLAPAHGRQWTMLWSSDDLTYDGPGRVDFKATRPWTIPAYSTHVLR